MTLASSKKRWGFLYLVFSVTKIFSLSTSDLSRPRTGAHWTQQPQESEGDWTADGINADEPPYETKDKNFYLPRIPADDCSCYAHACEQGKYKELAEKKEVLQKNIELIEQQMTAITNDMLDSPCGVTDEAMKTIYETDFARRGWPFTSYRKLIAETDCSLCPPPLFKQVIGLKNGYRDTTNFRLVPHVLPGIDPAKPISFSKTPESINYYWRVWPGRSEYEDTYSRQSRAIAVATQQYREPLPSSRRRC